MRGFDWDGHSCSLSVTTLQLKRYNLAVESASRALRILGKDGGAQQSTESELIFGL
eukprot:COSAG01_NODE_71719_length_255_cov_0.653846_2_plen_55_part_01